MDYGSTRMDTVQLAETERSSTTQGLIGFAKGFVDIDPCFSVALVPQFPAS